MCNHCPEGFPKHKPEMNLETRSTAELETRAHNLNYAVEEAQRQVEDLTTTLNKAQEHLINVHVEQIKLRRELRRRYADV